MVVARLIVPTPMAPRVAPLRVMEEAAVALMPPSNASVPERVTAPVFCRLTKLVTVAPLILREYPLAAVFSTPSLAPPTNATVPVVSVMLSVATSTSPVKMAPPVLPRVRLPRLLVVPATARVEVVAIVRFSVPEPLIEASEIAPAPVVMEEFWVRVVAANWRPLPVVCKAPPRLTPVVAVAVRPPANSKESLAVSPRVTTPVFCRITALVTEVLAPVNATTLPTLGR